MFIQAGRQENNPSPGSAILAYFQSSHPKLLGQRQRPFTHGTGRSISIGMSTVVSCGPRPHEGHRGWRVHSGFLRPQATRGTQRMARAQWFPVAPGHTRDTEDGVCSGFLWPQAVQRTQRMACAQWFPVAPRPYEGHRGHRWTPVLHWTELQERNTEPGNPRLFNTKSTTLLFVLKGDITSPVTVAYCKHNWKNCVGLEWSEPCIVDCLPQQYMSLARLRFLHEYPILSKFSKPGFSNM